MMGIKDSLLYTVVLLVVSTIHCQEPVNPNAPPQQNTHFKSLLKLIMQMPRVLPAISTAASIRNEQKVLPQQPYNTYSAPPHPSPYGYGRNYGYQGSRMPPPGPSTTRGSYQGQRSKYNTYPYPYKYNTSPSNHYPRHAPPPSSSSYPPRGGYSRPSYSKPYRPHDSYEDNDVTTYAEDPLAASSEEYFADRDLTRSKTYLTSPRYQGLGKRFSDREEEVSHRRYNHGGEVYRHSRKPLAKKRQSSTMEAMESRPRINKMEGKVINGKGSVDEKTISNILAQGITDENGDLLYELEDANGNKYEIIRNKQPKTKKQKKWSEK